MGKTPDIIEGEFKVVGERQPFWGPNASISNALYALMLGCGLVGHKDTGQPVTPLRSKVVYGLLLVIIVLARLLRET